MRGARTRWQSRTACRRCSGEEAVEAVEVAASMHAVKPPTHAPASTQPACKRTFHLAAHACTHACHGCHPRESKTSSLVAHRASVNGR